jgi:hypothetical protein
VPRTGAVHRATCDSLDELVCGLVVVAVVDELLPPAAGEDTRDRFVALALLMELAGGGLLFFAERPTTPDRTALRRRELPCMASE